MSTNDFLMHLLHCVFLQGHCCKVEEEHGLPLTPQVYGSRVYDTPQCWSVHACLGTHPYVIEKDEALEHRASVWQCVCIFPSGPGGGDY